MPTSWPAFNPSTTGRFYLSHDTDSGSTPSGMFLAVILILLALLFSIIDFLAVLLFIIIHKPHGIAKFISYTILIIVSWILFYFGIGIVTVYFNPLSL
jgi:hypothetical protein